MRFEIIIKKTNLKSFLTRFESNFSLCDVIIEYFIFVKEVWIFNSMVYSKTFFVLNV